MILSIIRNYRLKRSIVCNISYEIGMNTVTNSDEYKMEV